MLVPTNFKRLFREPLVHFFLAGAGLFFLFHLTNRTASEPPGKIVVTTARIQQLASTFARTWERPPTKEELDGLIQSFIREEVFYRQALSLGLDRDDTAIRRRLQQKMEFIAEDLVSRVEPTEQELQDYLVKHPDAFRREQQFTFGQVYLDPKQHGEALQQDTARVLAELVKPGADPAGFGDAFLLASEFKDIGSTEVASMFGKEFATQLGQLPMAKWQGPVPSAYGAHLVFIEQRTGGSLPRLDEVRAAVKQAWLNERQIEANENFYQGLLKRYTVVIEPLSAADSEKKLVGAKQ